MKYRKSPDKDLVIIPNVGRVAPGQVLEGPQFARFVKLGLLEEIKEPVKPKGPTSAEKAAKEKAKQKAAEEEKAAAAKENAAKAKAAKEKADALAEAKAVADAEAKAIARAARVAKAKATAETEAALDGDQGASTASDADDAQKVDPVSGEAAGAALEGAGKDPDETKSAEQAKMDKRAQVRRKKRT